MAKNSGKAGSSKIRFIMLEADLSEGDLSQVTTAIQNALRPQAQAVRFISSAPSGGNGAEEEQELVTDFADVEEPDTERRPRARSSKPRVARTPKVLDDIDLATKPSLEDFVGDFDLKTDVDRYLAIALWFRDARGVEAINVDQVYTCFRALGWSTSSNDFSKPLRNLRDEQSMRGGAKDGFSLTLVGAGKIEKKKRA